MHVAFKENVKENDDIMRGAMLSMTIFTSIGYWRIFEVISEDDEETYRSIGNEVVA